MKTNLVLTVAFGLIVALAPQVKAADSKPLVVLSLSSHRTIAGDVSEVSQIAKAAQTPTWLAATLKLFTEGQSVSGIDHSRPWGAVIERGEGLNSYAFVPVNNIEGLSWDLYEYIDSTTEVGDGIYKVTGTEASKVLYAKEMGGWLFVSDSPKGLANVPYSPETILGGLPKQYDVAVQFNLKNVPAKHGKKLLELLDSKLGPGLRRVASEETMNNIGNAAMALEHATLGWMSH